MESQARTDAASVEITVGDVTLPADLAVPRRATGVVIFAHGSGSSRLSPRNRFVAEQLNQLGLATLLMDLLTQQEEIEDQRTRALRFDISMLADRLAHAVDAAGSDLPTHDLPIGLFGASTGAAVSRGGRPDLAGDALTQVRCPTLLIVGGRDRTVVGLNQQAMEQLHCEKRLEIVHGATHLFEEPGALEVVAELAGDWFEEQLEQN